VDRTLLGIFRRVDALTVYDIAFRIHSLAAAPLGFTTTLALPAAATLDASDRPAQLRELFLRGTLYTIAIAVPAAVIILVMAPEFLHAWLGPEFADRSLEVRLFVSYLIVWCVPQVGWNMMIGLDRTARLLPVNLTSVAINVCVSAALVGRFGVAGVIAGTVAGNLVATPWYVSIFLRELNISVGELARTVLLRTYPQAIAVGLALMWIVRLVRPESLLAVGSLMAAAYAAYAALFWVTGIDAVDRARFQSLVRRRLVA
jgi:O-antigen/teichoic acid export membrane protein